MVMRLSSVVALLIVAAWMSPDAAADLRRQEIGSLILENVEPPAATTVEHLNRYLEARGATLLGWSPDGALLVRTRFGGTEQLHEIRAALGTRRQLTYFSEPIQEATWSPDSGQATIALLKDVGGDENYQLFLYHPAAGEARLLTSGSARHADPVWSPDGQQLAFAGTARNGVNFDIYIAQPFDTAPPRLVLPTSEDYWRPLAWSPSGDHLLLASQRSINASRLWLLDPASGMLTEVDGGPAPAGRGDGTTRPALLSADGRGVFALSDRDSEFVALRHINLDTGVSRSLTSHIPWDVEALAVSPDGSHVAFVSNEDGASRLRLIDWPAGTERAGPELGNGTITGLEFDASGRRLAFSLETPRSPRDVWVYQLDNGVLERWTQSEAGPVNAGRFVEPELIRYPTFDREGTQQRLIPAFVYRPPGAGPHPVLIVIHGGPEAQFRPGFDITFQFYVQELGYAVIAPNVRGSAGYGKRFVDLDNGRLREDSVRDIGALLDWIAGEADLDAERVVVLGGSYGGYMVLASLVHYGPRLRGGVDLVGISDFVTFLENTSGYRQDLRRVEYGDERDPQMRAFLREISPRTNASRIDRPLLVVQGLNDPRVPASESEQMVATIRRHGGEVWYLAARDEGHGFRKKQNRDFYQAVTAEFLSRLAQPEATRP